jgi:hypothetical protein
VVGGASLRELGGSLAGPVELFAEVLEAGLADPILAVGIRCDIALGQGGAVAGSSILSRRFELCPAELAVVVVPGVGWRELLPVVHGGEQVAGWW